MGIADHLTCLLRNLYAGQEATVRTGHKTTDCSKLGKEYDKAVHCHAVGLTSVQSTSCEMVGWINHKPESRLPGEKSITSDMHHHPNGRNRRGTKELLDEGEKESEKPGLNLNIQKMKIMAFNPITSWQIDGEKMKTVTDFIFLGSKVTTDGNCSREIKRHLLFGRKVTTNLDSILKSRDITLLTNVCIVKLWFFQ